MAEFHLSAKIIGRSAGQSAVAAAAYRSASVLHDQTYDKTHNFSRKQGLAHSEVLLPHNAPAAYADRAVLWNAVEAAEQRRDATLAREIEVAIPRGLNKDEAISLVRDYVQENFTKNGMIADLNIHWTTGADGGETPHAHIMLTTRSVGPDGFGMKVRDWNDKRHLLAWRESWADMSNAHLAQACRDERIDHRSYAARGIELEPQVKEGAARQIEQKHGQAERTDENAALRARNWHRISERPEIAAAALTERQSTFTARDVAMFLHRQAETSDQQALANLTARVLAATGVEKVGVAPNGEVRHSTREMIATERSLVERAVRLAAARSRAMLLWRLRRAAEHAGLKPEQISAVEHITGPERIALVNGLAGTGKTTMLKVAAELWQGRGLHVRGVALAGEAARTLGKEAGIASGTLASLLRGIETGREQLTRADVIVLDEAGMVGSRQMEALLAAVEGAGAKLVMVGDKNQLQAIDAGAPFRVLQGWVGVVQMEDVQRQKVEGDRRATVALGTGKTREALTYYESRSCVLRQETTRELHQAIVSRVLEDIAEVGYDDVLVVAHRRVDVHAINEGIRAELVKLGAVEQGSILPTVNGDRSFGAGDRVAFLAPNYGLGVKNGQVGVVEAVMGSTLRIKVEGRMLDVDLQQYDAIGHAYARTLHKGQGATAERVHTVLSGTMDAEIAYVALSRHRGRVQGYWSAEAEGSQERLFSRLERSRAKDTTLDYAQSRGIKPEQGETDETLSGMRSWRERRRARDQVADLQPAAQASEDHATARLEPSVDHDGLAGHVTGQGTGSSRPAGHQGDAARDLRSADGWGKQPVADDAPRAQPEGERRARQNHDPVGEHRREPERAFRTVGDDRAAARRAERALERIPGAVDRLAVLTAQLDKQTQQVLWQTKARALAETERYIQRLMEKHAALARIKEVERLQREKEQDRLVDQQRVRAQAAQEAAVHEPQQQLDRYLQEQQKRDAVLAAKQQEEAGRQAEQRLEKTAPLEAENRLSQQPSDTLPGQGIDSNADLKNNSKKENPIELFQARQKALKLEKERHVDLSEVRQQALAVENALYSARGPKYSRLDQMHPVQKERYDAALPVVMAYIKIRRRLSDLISGYGQDPASGDAEFEKRDATIAHYARNLPGTAWGESLLDEIDAGGATFLKRAEAVSSAHSDMQRAQNNDRSQSSSPEY